MIYKYYKNTFKEPPPPERRELFNKLYEKHDVKLIGVWKNQDNPLEYFMITAYKDEEHYTKFVETVKGIPEYLEMTKRISEVRIENVSKTLVEA